jgi:hypothetical protein
MALALALAFCMSGSRPGIPGESPCAPSAQMASANAVVTFGFIAVSFAEFVEVNFEPVLPRGFVQRVCERRMVGIIEKSSLRPRGSNFTDVLCRSIRDVLSHHRRAGMAPISGPSEISYRDGALRSASKNGFHGPACVVRALKACHHMVPAPSVTDAASMVMSCIWRVQTSSESDAFDVPW